MRGHGTHGSWMTGAGGPSGDIYGDAETPRPPIDEIEARRATARSYEAYDARERARQLGIRRIVLLAALIVLVLTIIAKNS